MEETAKLLAALTSEVEERKKTLQNLVNDINAISDVLQPALVALIRRMRDNRMAAVAEANSILSQMRDLRKFFLESDYEKEMVRLDRFVSLCHELKKLKDDGTLDQVADTMLNLAVQEQRKESRNERE